MARSRSRRSRSRRHSRRHSRSVSRRSRSHSRRHHVDRKTYHPCSTGGKCDLRHTYHSSHPAGAAKKYAKYLVKRGSNDGRVHIKEVTRGCGNNKVYTYTYNGRRLSRKEADECAFERDGVLVFPKVEVTVSRII